MLHAREHLVHWLPTEQLAKLAEVDRTTALRWKLGTHRVPGAVLRLIELTILGHVGPRAGPTWQQWFFDLDGLLCCPDMPKMRISGYELRAYLWLRYNRLSSQEIADLMRGIPAAPGPDALPDSGSRPRSLRDSPTAIL